MTSLIVYAQNVCLFINFPFSQGFKNGTLSPATARRMLPAFENPMILSSISMSDVQEIKGHVFKAKTFTTMTVCQQCHDALWGATKSAFECSGWYRCG